MLDLNSKEVLIATLNVHENHGTSTPHFVRMYVDSNGTFSYKTDVKDLSRIYYLSSLPLNKKFYNSMEEIMNILKRPNILSNVKKYTIIHDIYEKTSKQQQKGILNCTCPSCGALSTIEYINTDGEPVEVDLDELGALGMICNGCEATLFVEIRAEFE